MSELGLGLTVPVDANRDVTELAIARITPHESAPEPEVQKLYVWETDGTTLALGVTSEHPNVYLGDFVRRQQDPDDWSYRNGIVVGFKPLEFCVLVVEEGKAGIHAVPLLEIVSAARAWHRYTRDLLDPKLPVESQG